MSEDKLTRIVSFLMESLDTLNEQMQETSSAISGFMNALKRAKGDLSGMGITPKKSKGGFFSRKQSGGKDKEIAAQNLVSLLTGGAPAPASASDGGGGGSSGLPSGLPGAPSSGLPGAPSSAPSSSGPTMGLNLGDEAESKPPAGLPGAPPGPPGPPGPPSSGSGGGLPSAPPGPPGPPGPPSTPANAGAPAEQSGGPATFRSLRDEMLSELNRLKKIMKGS